MDKAGKQYWDDCWKGNDLPQVVDPDDTSIHNWINIQFDELFTYQFKDLKTKDLRLLEIGCAKSAWLPYFASRFGFDVTGIDYSDKGCELSNIILRANKVTGRIICTDLFNPPENLYDNFDVVISLGVVEHFENLDAVIAAVSKFAKPSGLIITVIPNLVGSLGWVQKILNNNIYKIHNPIDSSVLSRAHLNCDLDVILCTYFVSNAYNVLNVGTQPSKPTISFYIKQLIRHFMTKMSKLIWGIERIVFKLPTSRLFSPYIICVAKK